MVGTKEGMIERQWAAQGQQRGGRHGGRHGHGAYTVEGVLRPVDLEGERPGTVDRVVRTGPDVTHRPHHRIARQS